MNRRISCGVTLIAALIAAGVSRAQDPAKTRPRPGQVPTLRQTPSTTTNPPKSNATPETSQIPPRTGMPRSDDRTYRTNQALPEPDMTESPQPTIELPTVAIEPYLLQKEHGPFMVCARTFRGPDATKYALALVLELQSEHKLPAYIWHLRVHPMNSNIRGQQPTAPTHAHNGDMSRPEKDRIYDEAAVLVGNCKSIDESEKLLSQVKKLKPKCLAGLEPTMIFIHRRGQGLKTAFLTTNPLQGSQNLYPGRGLPTRPDGTFDPFVAVSALEKVRAKQPDKMLSRINVGPHSVKHCPGPFTLQVAEFRGRATLDTNDPTFKTDLRLSPLATAHDDSEKLAENLTKCKEMAGFKPYVFHDRTSSKVFIGAFSGPDDPALKRLDTMLPKISTELITRGMSQLYLAPSRELSEVPKL